MGKVVVMMSVSLDGYIEGPGGDLSWHRVDDEVHEHFNAVLRPMGRFLNGRTMFELMAQFWPTADEQADSTPAMVEFARIWREMPKTVYSRTLQHAGWNATIAREIQPEEVRALKDQTAGDLSLGGAQVADEFLARGLVDELRLYVHPVVLGEGRHLFATTGTRSDLSLVQNHTFGNGVVLLRYTVG